MKKIFRNKGLFFELFAWIVLSINIYFLLFFIFKGYLWFFHSDSAVKVLLAREIYDTKSYFPSDWNYVNKDLFVVFGHLFILPLLNWFPASFLTHAFSGVINSLLVLGSIWLLTGLTTLSRAYRLIILAVFAGGLSITMAENLYGQASYGPLIYFTCFILFATWKLFITNKIVHLWSWGTFLGVAIFLVSLANPLRSLVYYALPLLTSLLFFRYYYSWTFPENKNKNISIIFCVTLTGLVLGAVIHNFVLASVNNMQGAGNVRLLSYDEIVRNLSLLPFWFVELLSGTPTKGQNLMSKVGIYQITRFIGAIGFIFLLFKALINFINSKNLFKIYITLFTTLLTLIILFFQLLTTIPSMEDVPQSARYLVSSVVMLLVIFLINIFSNKEKSIAYLVSLFITITFIFGVTPAYYFWEKPEKIVNRHQYVSTFLDKSGLYYGYSSYWNAGVISVMSDERVRVRPIIINNQGIPIPFRHLTSNRWYRPSYWSGESFLMVTADEDKLINHKLLSSYGLIPIKKLNFDKYIIYVYSFNIANSLPNWNSDFREPFTYRASEKSFRQIGKYHDSYLKFGSVLVAEKGETGWLHHGPYVRLDSGKYRVIFDVVSERDDKDVVKIDIYSSSDPKLFIEKNLSEISGPEVLEFVISKPESMEFRVWSTGRARVILRGITLQRVD